MQDYTVEATVSFVPLKERAAKQSSQDEGNRLMSSIARVNQYHTGEEPPEVLPPHVHTHAHIQPILCSCSTFTPPNRK